MSDRAVIYARFSTHNQRSESIEIQVDNCADYCVEHGLELVGVYQDEAKTGRNTDRAQFQQMLEDAKRGAFDYVVIYKVTRIMRNRDEMSLARIMLRKCGVEILYAGEDISSGSAGVLQLGMLEVLAEWESAIDSERIRDGIQKNAERCMANGQTLLGWDIVGGFYQINDVEARELRKAKDAVISGVSATDAARAMAIRTKRGKTINCNALTKLLKRKQNAGIYCYAGVEKEGGMPALWSMEEQSMLWSILGDGTRPRKKHFDTTYALTGKLWCGKCDKPMAGAAGTGKSGKVYYYYRCKCCNRRVRKDILETNVAEAVMNALKDAENRERIADLVCEYESESTAPKQSEVIKSELADIELSYERIWRAIEQGVAPPGGKERIEQMQQRQQMLQDELKVAQAVEAVRLDRDRVLFWLENIAGTADETTLINTFVTRVTLCDDNMFEVLLMFDGVGRKGRYGVRPESPKPHHMFMQAIALYGRWPVLLPARFPASAPIAREVGHVRRTIARESRTGAQNNRARTGRVCGPDVARACAALLHAAPDASGFRIGEIPNVSQLNPTARVRHTRTASRNEEEAAYAATAAASRVRNRHAAGPASRERTRAPRSTRIVRRRHARMHPGGGRRRLTWRAPHAP